MWGFAPWLNKLGRDFGFTEAIVAGCSALFIITLLLRDPGQSLGGGIFSFLAPSQKAIMLFGASGSYPVFVLGRWWTVLSAGWLHGGLLHIVMNMMCVRYLMPAMTDCYGVGRSVIIYTIASLTGFGLTSFLGLFMFLPAWLHGATVTVGASASIFGLLGALVFYGQRTGNRSLSRQIWQWVITWVVLGFILQFVDNWAHLGGFAGGWLAARFLDPLKAESPQHLVGALVCLGATLLSILVSVLHGLQFMG
jgi:membrane associated rhomboid family serine protease